MNIQFTAKWLQHLLKKNQNPYFLKSSVLELMFRAGILVAFVLPSFKSQLLAQSANSPTATPVEAPTQREQKPTSPPDKLGKELLQQLFVCIKSNLSSSQKPSEAALEAASMQCMFKVVMLTPDGKVRPDASDRLTSVVKATGISMPEPISQGQASIKLKPLAESQVFTVPVIIGGQPKTFLFDTGASASMVDNKTAAQLGLKGTPIPNDLLKYMVVGNNCSQVNANVHPLPALAVNSATVKGLMGIGLSQTAIPGNLSGVLGLDFLSSFDVILNPKTFQLQLLPPSNPVKQAIPLVGKLGAMTAQVRINGQGPFTFMLDTGADVIVVSKPLAQKLSLDVANAKATEVEGFCGSEKGKQTKLAQVSLQQYQATQLDAVILDSSALDLVGVEGIIGQNFLNRYQQHWRFGKRDALGFPETGSLVLTPLPK